LTADRIELLAAVLQAIRSEHVRARNNVCVDVVPRRIHLVDQDTELFDRLLSKYSGAEKVTLQQAALRGVAKLFAINVCPD
jgi:hypothetical protein